MPKSKRYYDYEIPSTVVDIVKTVCADYTRREQAIKYNGVSGETLANYINLNGIIDDALSDIETGIREELLRDIGRRRGYEQSNFCYCISKNAYYRRKRKLIYDIAKGLNLLP
ncbi:MAG: hypothetical protein LUD19_01285 [Clostridia bacterium]|nr:hypothetical protein [Clostridia bacterium]